MDEFSHEIKDKNWFETFIPKEDKTEIKKVHQSAFQGDLVY